MFCVAYTTFQVETAVVAQRILQSLAPFQIDNTNYSSRHAGSIYPTDGRDMTLLRSSEHALQLPKIKTSMCTSFIKKMHIDSQRELIFT